jgi:ferric-dicitrate binding protein FerR (iron transport regulator)
VRPAVRRTRRRRGPLAAALAACLAVAAGIARVGVVPPAAVVVAPLESLAGGDTVEGAGAAAGRSVGAGATVDTGPGGHAALRLASGPALRLDRASRARLDSAAAVTLVRGALYVDSGPGAERGGGSGGVTVTTALGTARELGTQFEVRLLPGPAGGSPGGLRVRVREGAVVVDQEGQRYRAEAGGELTLTAGGDPERAAVAPDAGAWDWVQRAAAPLAIEGLPLGVYLDWVGRETGRPWGFTPAVREGASDIVLHGSIEGLTPEQSLGVVLPGCGLAHRIEGGALRIEPAPNP